MDVASKRTDRAIVAGCATPLLLILENPMGKFRGRISDFKPITQQIFEGVVRNSHANSGQCVCAACLIAREKIEQLIEEYRANLPDRQIPDEDGAL